MNNSSKNEAGICVKCGTCTSVCPVFLATGNEIYSPRGRQHLKAEIAGGEFSRHYAEIFSKCLLCGACREVCPRQLDTPELVVNVRADLPRLSGLSFLKYLSRKALVHPLLLTNLTRLGAAANGVLAAWLPPESGLRLRLQGFDREIFKLPDRGYIAKLRSDAAAGVEQPKEKSPGPINYFTGCLADHLQPEIAEATQLLLARTTSSRAAVAFSQTCCGLAALAAGRKDEARELARKNIMAFEENDAPILTSCSSCYYQLKSYGELLAGEPEWRERAARFAGRLREFSTFFLEKFSGMKTFPTRAGADSHRKILYHDPCHLRFRLQITEAPRRLLRLLPGVELQELPDGPRCCGQGGLFQVAHPELARNVQAELLADFAALQAETVLSACSGCLLQWRQGLQGLNKSCRAEHPAVFIARFLG